MTGMPVKNSDTVSNEIRVLHDIHGLTFREIANLPTWIGIPFGTIAHIYHGGRVPNKWRKKLDLPRLVKVPETMVRKKSPNGTGRQRPPRIAVRKDDPESAAQSLKNNIDSSILDEIIRLLKGQT